MPVSLQKLIGNVSTVTIRDGEDSITVEYYPARVTEKTFADLQRFSAISATTILESFSALNDMLIQLVKSWDIYEDEEHQVMFPLDAERLEELPIKYRSLIVGAILEDFNPEVLAPQNSQR